MDAVQNVTANHQVGAIGRPRQSHLLSCLLPIVLLLVGCASIQPAIPPDESQVVEQEPVEEVSPESPQADPYIGDAAPPQRPDSMTDEEVDVLFPAPDTAVVETNDELVIPDDALPEMDTTSPIVNLDEYPAQPDPTQQTFEEIYITEGPLPPGPEPVPIIEGWRVQIASLGNLHSAERLADSVRNTANEHPMVRWRDGTYKVQVGDCPTIEAALALRDRLRACGFPEAFVVSGRIRATEVDSSATDSVVAGMTGDFSPAVPDSPQLSQPEQQVEGWRIQIISMGTRDAAERIAGQARSRLRLTAYVVEQGGLFKVMVGDFLTREEANEARRRVVASGYEGAFPVSTTINR